MKRLVCYPFIYLHIEQAKLYVSGLKFWYENYQNTLNLKKIFDDDCSLKDCIKQIVEKTDYSSVGRKCEIGAHI